MASRVAVGAILGEARIMSFAHVTLPTREVEKTAAFLEQTLEYSRAVLPSTVVEETVWLNLGDGQQLHVFYVEGFEASPFEREFGRHVALFYPRPRFDELKQRLRRSGGELIEPLRATPFDRFFFREPVNGYVFEVIDSDQKPRASHLDQ
jgi:catechol 2,3-dioxygenase-like lactoylglutathione lyase family enzyme